MHQYFFYLEALFVGKLPLKTKDFQVKIKQIGLNSQRSVASVIFLSPCNQKLLCFLQREGDDHIISFKVKSCCDKNTENVLVIGNEEKNRGKCKLAANLVQKYLLS